MTMFTMATIKYKNSHSYISVDNKHFPTKVIHSYHRPCFTFSPSLSWIPARVDALAVLTPLAGLVTVNTVTNTSVASLMLSSSMGTETVPLATPSAESSGWRVKLNGAGLKSRLSSGKTEANTSYTVIILLESKYKALH